MKKQVLFSFLVCLFSVSIFSQELSNRYIKEQIATFKKELRGPYKDIRWFCKDGSIRMPKDPCPDSIGSGVQHARYKDIVENIGENNHVFLGQILAYTSNKEFWDSQNHNSRLKQYQLDKYLRSVDDGWILQKAQYYRGAVQVEDEETWGVYFYKWLLTGDTSITKNFFLIRQSLKDIPHKGDDNVAQLMRSQSKVLSDSFPQFMDLRVKIHGQPEFVDIEKVKQFKTKNASKLTTALNLKFDELLVTMNNYYKPIDISALPQKTSFVKNTPIGSVIKEFSVKNGAEINPAILVSESAKLLLEIRKAILVEKRALARIQLLDASLKLEEVVFKNASQWQPKDIQELLSKTYYLGVATAGAGYIELWEWNKIESVLKPKNSTSLSLNELTTILQSARSEVEWSASMVKATYEEIVNVYNGFEPKSYGFIDDKIRSSVALHLGKSVADLGDIIATESSLTNKVLNISSQSSVRGLNPGYAFGELVVIDGSPEGVEVSSNKIYIFQKPPSDLKPVGGIATVAEGNLVSHVQLLARNLGIPNAALSDDNLQSLKKFNGQKVFYAVSNKGNVILKLEKDMTLEEKGLFSKKERNEAKIAVPVENIRLDVNSILNMRNVDAKDSGKLCGPKAANLGQLKKMFPDKVVEGVVIPFGIFKSHMNQQMPDQNISYWNFLTNMFLEADRQRSNSISEIEVEKFQLKQLEILRDAIKKMPIQASFITQLENEFLAVLGKKLGEIPVFLRSDTNMEDLKDFSGAGLNLTLFNVVAKDKIIQGIKDVWASPYTERSFKWRQKYLLNPENVFPSILVIPSVDVDYSGVMITTGINSGNSKDLTIAFSRGAGGAVDGQSAEAYELGADGTVKLIAPARESDYNSLPTTGGTAKKSATFENSVLNEQNIKEIRELAENLRKKMAKEVNAEYIGAYDVELGFKNNKLWLFQIRPFVENKKALSSGYLESITPKIDKNKEVLLSKKI
ncbi:PEP/pyruvate-binding domain-containing protein [Lutibacter flavus]|uniref:Phosphoenolpyruvate synthase n=1 Tax=Lutibacter flavus TaxID=691689 RepID=A0A238VCX0_9FLAO|nr:PEP/pyruvate-binding domain-containing protein [Lutibacter flavus]SNR32096.1 Pyruvate phosphate dikinase, PEP/pyruvate binding domain [Lutibacter flavus]